MILLVENCKDKKRLLAIKNIDKIAIPQIEKMLSSIDFDGKYSKAINSGDMDFTKDF